MPEEIKFKSLNDLYQRLLPALRSKVKELKKDGFNYIYEEDIWNFLKKVRWLNSRDLDLGEMVNDIFSISHKEIDQFVKEQIKDYRRHISEDK